MHLFLCGIAFNFDCLSHFLGFEYYLVSGFVVALLYFLESLETDVLNSMGVILLKEFMNEIVKRRTEIWSQCEFLVHLFTDGDIILLVEVKLYVHV